MIRKSIYFIVTLIFVGVTSCIGNKDGNNGEENIGSLSQSSDGIDLDSTRLKAQEPEKPILSLPTTESQLQYMKQSKDHEKYESGILIQMAEDVPEYCEKILQTDGQRFIIVDKAKMKLFLYDPYGNVELQYGIACSKNYGNRYKSWDSRTREGFFNVKEICNSTEWYFTDENGVKGTTKGVYGPRFIRLNIPSIGIHGTNSPSSIGKRCSHGCIRVTNDHIMELVKYVEEGMPVIISPGPRDMAVNESENNRVPSVATEPGTPRAKPYYWESKQISESKDEPGTQTGEILEAQPTELQEQSISGSEGESNEPPLPQVIIEAEEN